MGAKFGERKTGTWSQKDWHAHKRFEQALRKAAETAKRVDPIQVFNIPECDVFSLPTQTKQRGEFMLDYAFKLNSAYIAVSTFFEKECGWSMTLRPLGRERYSAKLHRRGSNRGMVNSYCKSMLCVQTWAMTMYAINTVAK